MARFLKVATFNAENFSLLLSGIRSRVQLDELTEAAYQSMNASIFNPNKERRKIAEIARLILTGRFDVVGLCEVGGRETLEAFNRLYLDGGFDTYLHEENSRRGIFVGALVRKGRFSELKASNLPGAFARNVLRLDLGRVGGNLQVFVVHLKSQLGSDWGLEHRLKEVAWLSSVVPTTRCVVMGDFNGILIREQPQFEYEAFLRLPFRDVLEAVGVPPEKRRTHYHFAPEPHFAQLDYIFCSNDLLVRNAKVLEGKIPLNRAQRNYLPSDHLMVEAKVGWHEEKAQFWSRVWRWLR
ncbi:MAG: endonuclease/exonuclease/phosphatase family protein [Spirochaetales bacterium]